MLAFTLVKQASGGTALETIRYLDKQTLASVIPFHLACDFQGKTGRSLDRKNREGVAICCGSLMCRRLGSNEAILRCHENAKDVVQMTQIGGSLTGPSPAAYFVHASRTIEG